MDKLIEKLDDERKSGLALHDFSMVGSYVNAIKIVNELAEEYNDGWHPYSETNLPPAGYVREVWLTLEDGVFKTVWMRDHFEWENGRKIEEMPLAWKFYNIPEPYQPKGE